MGPCGSDARNTAHKAVVCRKSREAARLRRPAPSPSRAAVPSSGPFGVNGVPLKRVNQAYVIATSTKVALPAKLPVEVDDAYFKREEPKPTAGEAGFFASAKTKTVPSEKRKADQEAMDKALAKVVDGTEMLKAYLQAKFSLKKGDKPHEMKF